MSNDIEELIIQTVRRDDPETAQQLMMTVAKKVSLPGKNIMQVILKLQKEGKITFHKPSAVEISQNLGAYLKTRDAFWYWATVGLTFLCAIAVFGFQSLGLQGLIRFAPGAVLVVGLPGYSLVRILFPGNFTKSGKTQAIDILTSFALTVVLSIVLVSIVGLVLNYTQWGVQLNSLVLSLSFLTLFLATAAIVRENRNLKKLLGELKNGK